MKAAVTIPISITGVARKQFTVLIFLGFLCWKLKKTDTVKRKSGCKYYGQCEESTFWGTKR